MNCKPLFRSLSVAAVLSFGISQGAHAATEIQFWHGMEAALGERLNDIANAFNASQSDYKIVPVFKGSYDQTLAAGIAAYRSGNAPAILQVYEVGTATMMQAKKAVIPCAAIKARSWAKPSCRSRATRRRSALAAAVAIVPRAPTSRRRLAASRSAAASSRRPSRGAIHSGDRLGSAK